jgi:hypothetical protein
MCIRALVAYFSRYSFVFGVVCSNPEANNRELNNNTAAEQRME